MWSYRAPVALVIIGSLGSIPRSLKDKHLILQIYHANLIPKIQRSILLSSWHILHQFENYSNLLDKVQNNSLIGLSFCINPALLCLIIINTIWWWVGYRLDCHLCSLSHYDLCERIKSKVEVIGSQRWSANFWITVFILLLYNQEMVL